jgi:hypothetical protein
MQAQDKWDTYTKYKESDVQQNTYFFQSMDCGKSQQ